MPVIYIPFSVAVIFKDLTFWYKSGLYDSKISTLKGVLLPHALKKIAMTINKHHATYELLFLLASVV